jgi:hypothetical protein
MIVFLVPAGGDRFELYSETPEDDTPPDDRPAGPLRRLIDKANRQWRALVDTAREGRGRGRWARWRDAVVCRLAESIAEQRTLWALRHESSSALRYPATLDEPGARAIVSRVLAHARTHHGRWLAVDLVLFIASGILFFVPGPNLVAYYLAFRVVGHLNSWRGARRSIERMAWSFEPDATLGELTMLTGVPRADRAAQVADIAARLQLHRLPAFFDRVAA